MEIIRTPREMQTWTAQKRCENQTVGFVPTMGALHDGHLTLARRAREECDFVVASIFVNPTQFGPKEDFATYARPFERDCELLRAVGCDVLFAPENAAMYPALQMASAKSSAPESSTRSVETFVEVAHFSGIWEGAIRPGHLRGVATIVTKLFNLVRPHRAYFGEKDFQQLKVIEHLSRDLFFDLEIVPCETVRESDGLARSSRNANLSAAERDRAPILYRALQSGVEMARGGERDVSKLEAKMREICAQEPQISLQYLAIVDAQTLVQSTLLGESPAHRVLVAARLGRTRLIDNVAIGVSV